jgi:hypothetical protein
MELPPVAGWERPSVDIPVFELSDWDGPRWVILYQGQDGSLEELTLAFGDVDTQRSWIGVTTYAKRPGIELRNGRRTRSTSFAGVASSVLMLLIERATDHLPEGDDQSELRRQLGDKLHADGAVAMGLDELPTSYWSPIEVSVDDLPTAAYATQLLDSWAVCLDEGTVFVSASGNGERPESLRLQAVRDLRPYRMPGLTE